MGLISQLEDGNLYLEGIMKNGIFQVISCDRDKTLNTYPETAFFGDGRPYKKEMIRLANPERKAVNDTFVILSDIWLEDEEVIGKLETVLHNFESMEIVPSLFVFMGNFCSRKVQLSAL